MYLTFSTYIDEPKKSESATDKTIPTEKVEVTVQEVQPPPATENTNNNKHHYYNYEEDRYSTCEESDDENDQPYQPEYKQHLISSQFSQKGCSFELIFCAGKLK